jgi:hypothetical protein
MRRALLLWIVVAAALASAASLGACGADTTGTTCTPAGADAGADAGTCQPTPTGGW